jgi:hypothetical protein
MEGLIQKRRLVVEHAIPLYHQILQPGHMLILGKTLIDKIPLTLSKR